MEQMSFKSDPFMKKARWFKALAHPERLRILDALRRDEACVCHLENLLGRPQPYISQQLRVLREAGIVGARRQGANVFYYITDDQALRVLDTVLGPAEESSMSPRTFSCRCPKCQVGDEGVVTAFHV